MDMLETNLVKRRLLWLALPCLILLVQAATPAQTPSIVSTSPEVVAVIDNKHAITRKDVDDTLGTRLIALEEQIYALRKNALENLITERLLRETAKTRGVTVEELKNSFIPGKVNITTLQVEEEYSKAAQSMGDMGEDEAKQRLKIELEGFEKIRLYKEALAKLREGAKVEVNLPAPDSKLVISNTGPAKGPATAPVQLVEFSDFQCPYCKRAQGFLGEVLQEYGSKVQHVFKHLPLTIHSEAFISAQASVCAHGQGKFWEFHDRLFESDDLSAKALKKYAGDLSLNLDEYDKCMASPGSRAEVLKDLAEARRANVEGTPTFFINGKRVRGVGSAADLRKVIDAELKQVAADAGSR